MGKLSVKGLAVGVGVSWSVCILFAGWAGIFSWCTEFVKVMSSVYIGYKPTFLGGIIGAVWGFIDGAVVGAIIAFVYNMIVREK